MAEGIRKELRGELLAFGFQLRFSFQERKAAVVRVDLFSLRGSLLIGEKVM